MVNVNLTQYLITRNKTLGCEPVFINVCIWGKKHYSRHE